MSEIKLKPCPFCGEKEDIDYGVNYGTLKGFDYVECQNCGAEVNAWHKSDKTIAAIEVWNMRVDDDTKLADTAKIVRCKDCKHYQNHPNGLCYLHTEPCDNKHKYKGDTVCVEPNDFCSFGERRTDNG